MAKQLEGDYRRYLDKAYLGAWDLPDREDLVLTIDYITLEDVQNDRGTEEKLTAHFMEHDYKPMILNVTNAKSIAAAYGSTKVETWRRKKIALYKTNINAFGENRECIRIRNYAPKTDEIYCDRCGSLIKDHVDGDKTYKAKAIANNALSKFGQYLCWDCAIEMKGERDGTEE